MGKPACATLQMLQPLTYSILYPQSVMMDCTDFVG